METTHNLTMQNVEYNELIVAKVVAMLVLGLASFIIGLVPIKVTKLISINTSEDKNLTISLLLCFGGGVLLFTTFIHLQPEVRESFAAFEQLIDPIFGNGIPTSEIVFCLGFFFVYLIEELVHMILDRKINDNPLHRTLSVRCPNKDLSIPRVSLTKFDDSTISCISTSNKELLNSQSTVNIVDKHEHDHSHHGHHHFDESMNNSFSGLLAVLALSFHAVFEGLAVGLEGNKQKVWYLFAAIATHKLVIAFCVGVELVASKTKTLFVFIYIGTFALVTPLGIGAGILLSQTGKSDESIATVVLQGMAAGTLLYVVFFEVLAREKNNKHSGLWQLCSILAGFLVMLTLQVLTGHEHSHGGHAEEAHEHAHAHAHAHVH